jgi:hypothetical protein
MKKLLLCLAFTGLLSFASSAEQQGHFVGCGTWIIWCDNHPAYYAIACTVEELNTWRSILCANDD